MVKGWCGKQIHHHPHDAAINPIKTNSDPVPLHPHTTFVFRYLVFVVSFLTRQFLRTTAKSKCHKKSHACTLEKKLL